MLWAVKWFKDQLMQQLKANLALTIGFYSHINRRKIVLFSRVAFLLYICEESKGKTPKEKETQVLCVGCLCVCVCGVSLSVCLSVILESTKLIKYRFLLAHGRFFIHSFCTVEPTFPQHLRLFSFPNID